MTQSSEPNKAELYKALAKAQGEFSGLAKNREVEIIMKSGGRYKFRYADLEAVLSATRPALAANGLAVVQVIAGDALETVLTHESGASITSSVPLPTPGGGDIKSYGATIMYLRRYAYTSLLCVAADDDLDENGQEAAPAQAPAPAVDISPELETIANAQSVEELKAAGRAANDKYPQHRAAFIAAYNERKKALDEFERAAKAEAIDAECDEENNDDIPGV